MGLRDEREAITLEPLDEPDLPQRLLLVERLGEHSPGKRAQRSLVARLGQPGVADVVAEVEVRVVDPARQADTERRRNHALAVARHEGEALPYALDELVVLGWFAREG